MSKDKTKVIALCQAEDSMPETTDEKVAIAEQLVERVTKMGIPLDDLYIDPLVYPLSTNPLSTTVTLRAFEKIMSLFPGVHTSCGLTDVSYGLPSRKLVNRTFLVSAIANGLDSAILDPTGKNLYSALQTALVVNDKDDFCMNFITAVKEGKIE